MLRGRDWNTTGRQSHRSSLAAVAGMRKCATENSATYAALTHHKRHLMDVEHINAIGNTLADLTKRTVDLRGYL